MLHASLCQFDKRQSTSQIDRKKTQTNKQKQDHNNFVNNVVNPVFRRTLKGLFTTTARIPVTKIYLLCTIIEIKILISSGNESIFPENTRKSQLLYLISLNIALFNMYHCETSTISINCHSTTIVLQQHFHASEPPLP